MGAAWITKTYWQYKLVVVNAWVDIPDEHELEAQAHASLHQSHANDKNPKAPGNGLWGSIVDKMSKKDSDGQLTKTGNGNIEAKEDIELTNVAKKENSNGRKTSSGDSITR